MGFRPDKGTLENLRHGEALMRECDHGSILQMHKWFQDQNSVMTITTKI